MAAQHDVVVQRFTPQKDFLTLIGTGASAVQIIPRLSMPRSRAGLRLATATTVLPTSSSGWYFAAMPATIWRGSSSPMSTEMLPSSGLCWPKPVSQNCRGEIDDRPQTIQS